MVERGVQDVKGGKPINTLVFRDCNSKRHFLVKSKARDAALQVEGYPRTSSIVRSSEL